MGRKQSQTTNRWVQCVGWSARLSLLPGLVVRVGDRVGGYTRQAVRLVWTCSAVHASRVVGGSRARCQAHRLPGGLRSRVAGSAAASRLLGGELKLGRWCVACRFFFFSSRRRHTRCSRDWSSDVCSSDLPWHGWEYDVATGKVKQNPAVGVDCYPVEVRGEDIFVDAG